jgi:hypothetical protein
VTIRTERLLTGVGDEAGSRTRHALHTHPLAVDAQHGFAVTQEDSPSEAVTQIGILSSAAKSTDQSSDDGSSAASRLNMSHRMLRIVVD